MGKLVQTAPCRFCGQMIQLEDQEEEYTKEQAEEAATEQCNCEEAQEYRKNKKRKKRAIRNVQQLFGEDAEPGEMPKWQKNFLDRIMKVI